MLAVLSGLEAKSASELDRYLKLIDQVLERKAAVRSARFSRDATGPVTAEQLYVNQKVSDLISNAEMEQSDYRRGTQAECLLRREETLSRTQGRTSSSSTPSC